MKKNIILFLLLFLLLLAGCGKDETVLVTMPALQVNQIYVYMVNSDMTDLVPQPYSLQNKESWEEEGDALLKYLQEVPAEAEWKSPVPQGITYQECKAGKRPGNLEIRYLVVYDSVNTEDLLFFKGGVVKSLLQIEGIESVTLFLTDEMNANDETATVSESFDADSFTMSFGNDAGYKQKGTIVLYFANESGEALKEYHKTIEITNNTSLARLVVESLIAGPKREGYMATIPDTTTIRNISVKDNICYLDLSDEFYDAANPLRNDIIVYSVVNSLVELPTVSKVQFLRNGEKQELFRETLLFDGIFERDLNLNEENTTEEVSTEEGQLPEETTEVEQ